MIQKIKMQDCVWPYSVTKAAACQGRASRTLDWPVTSVSTQWLLFNIWLYFLRVFIQSFYEPAVWLVLTMGPDSSKPLTAVSKLQKWHAEIFQSALWEPSLQPGAGLAMPAWALPQLGRFIWDSPDVCPLSRFLLLAMPWFFSPSKLKTSSRMGERRTTAQ